MLKTTATLTRVSLFDIEFTHIAGQYGPCALAVTICQQRHGQSRQQKQRAEVRRPSFEQPNIITANITRRAPAPLPHRTQPSLPDWSRFGIQSRLQPHQ
jgi:hypothetical protein